MENEDPSTADRLVGLSSDPSARAVPLLDKAAAQALISSAAQKIAAPNAVPREDFRSSTDFFTRPPAAKIGKMAALRCASLGFWEFVLAVEDFYCYWQKILLNYTSNPIKSNRRVFMSSYDLDMYFPLQGTCFHCGRDARHWLIDEIKERFSAGESVNSLAAQYDVPLRAIELVIRQNSSSPLGISFGSTSRARAAAA